MIAPKLIHIACTVACAATLTACAVVKQEAHHCPIGKDCHNDGHDRERHVLSDARMKQDVRQIGIAENGLPIYLFRYKGEETWRIGVMAQDVLQQSPGAVSQREDGYYVVNYGRIAW